MSVKRKAHELAKAIKESPEYERLTKAREVVEQREAAKIMLQDVEKKQKRLREKYAAGEQPSEAEIEDLRQTMELVSFNPYIRDLFEAEFAFGKMIAEVWEIIAEALGLELPQAQPQGDEPEPTVSKASSKLWVPGRDF
ncbi:MAG: YlbF family regulator [Firmicutes bacterium]|nr:YlbF family regulator [Bacillota bacterium]